MAGPGQYLLINAATYQRRLVVFSGPVLAPAGPRCRGVQLPLRFLKVAALTDHGGLAATAYVLDHTPLIGDLLEAAADEPPPLRPFRSLQVPVTDIAVLTGLERDQPAPPTGCPPRWWTSRRTSRTVASFL